MMLLQERVLIILREYFTFFNNPFFNPFSVNVHECLLIRNTSISLYYQTAFELYIYTFVLVSCSTF